MKNIKKNSKQDKLTIIMGIIAATLLVFSVVGSTQAALTYYSETYSAQFEMFDIGVTLVENEKDISYRDYTQKDDVWYEHTGVLLEHMLDGEDLKVGKAYKQEMTVRNSGNIDEYVRVTVNRYWVDSKGNKQTYLSPDLIKVHFLEKDGWVIDKDASTAERTVLYYKNILSINETAPLFSDTLTIDEAIANDVDIKTAKSEDGKTNITMTYRYQDIKFILEANVDAVQTHNAADAIKSAWGVDVTIGSDKSLSLVK